MRENTFEIEFELDNQPYIGRVQPSSELKPDGTPASFHVLLNNEDFADLSFKDCRWSSSEQKPAGLVKLIGKQIEKHFQL